MKKISFHRGDIAAGGQDHLSCLGSYSVIEDTNWSLVLQVGNDMYKADPDDLPCEQGTSVTLDRVAQRAIITYTEKGVANIYKVYAMDLESCMILPKSRAERELAYIKEMYPESDHTLHIIM